MTYDIYTYLNQLQRYLADQDRRIKTLEMTVESLSAELTKLKEKPPITVERIEYKFDQLKVEKLDGTLNIGLNPNELQNMDEFSVNAKQMIDPYVFPEREQMADQIYAEIQQYMNKDVNESLSKIAIDSGIKVDPAYFDFIKDDLMKQLPPKINYYIDQSLPDEKSPDKLPYLKEKITERLKEDIFQAIYVFFNSSQNK